MVVLPRKKLAPNPLGSPAVQGAQQLRQVAQQRAAQQGPQAPRGAPGPTSPSTPADDARQAAVEAAKQKSRDALAAAGGRYDPGTGTSTTAQHPAVDDNSDVSDLASLRMQQEKERQAAQQELAASKAKALQDADARAGLGGFGLSGASAALHADVNRLQDRSAVEAMSQLDQQQRDEQWQEVQRQIALDDLEQQENTDLNGDGKIGGDADPKAKAKQAAADASAIDANLGGSGKDNDPFGGIGGASQGALQQLVDAGVTFTVIRAETGTFNGEKYVYVRGSDGNFYKFKVPGSGLGNTPSDADAVKWFNSQVQQ